MTSSSAALNGSDMKDRAPSVITTSFRTFSISELLSILSLHAFNSEVQWGQREAFMGTVDKQ
jgi:hypothetical protein